MLEQYKTPAFNPNDYLIAIIKKNDDGTAVIDESGNPIFAPYLPAIPRINWFYTVYPNGSIRTEIINLSESQVTVKAMIYRDLADVNYASDGYGTRYRGENGSYGQNYISTATTAAIGKALANLGFSTPLDATLNSEARNQEISASLEEGEPTEDVFVNHKPPVKTVEKKVSAEEKASVEEVEEPREEVKPEKTISSIVPANVEEAKKVVISFGAFEGKTMGEILDSKNANNIFVGIINSKPENLPESKAAKILHDYMLKEGVA